jgi:hypothetical protein
MRKCELWEFGKLGGTGTLLGFAGTLEEVRAIVEMDSGFLCSCALGGVKMLPAATKAPKPDQVRDETLEEAAKECLRTERRPVEQQHCGDVDYLVNDYPVKCAAAIRALKATPAAAPAGEALTALADELLTLRCVNPHPEDACCLYSQGYYKAMREASAAILAKRPGREA